MLSSLFLILVGLVYVNSAPSSFKTNDFYDAIMKNCSLNETNSLHSDLSIYNRCKNWNKVMKNETVLTDVIYCHLYFNAFTKFCKVTDNIQDKFSLAHEIYQLEDVCANIKAMLSNTESTPIKEMFQKEETCKQFCSDEYDISLDCKVVAHLLKFSTQNILKNTTIYDSLSVEHVTEFKPKQNGTVVSEPLTSQVLQKLISNDSVITKQNEEQSSKPILTVFTAKSKLNLTESQVVKTKEHEEPKQSSIKDEQYKGYAEQKEQKKSTVVYVEAEQSEGYAEALKDADVKNKINDNIDNNDPDPPELENDYDETKDIDDKLPEKILKPETIDETDAVNYSNDMDGNSYFFTYFMVLCILFVVGYVCYFNKQKILALILEGRRGRKQYRGRRPNSANYHKLDSNLEEAITSSCSKNTSNVIY